MKEFQKFTGSFEVVKSYLQNKKKIIVILCTRGENSFIYTKEEMTYDTWYEHFEPIREIIKIRYNDLCKKLNYRADEPIIDCYIDTYRIAKSPVDIVEYCGVPQLFYYYDLVKEQNERN